ncbi:beta-lactamase [Streptomyces nojiriensis]|uniref:Beta-lactamase n=1 Tax=Streptomyces nojiriensis TaxID=66374 RepID=A0ABQ3SZ87_9ACTN|nr:serine hydrolase domain-containing protein [Streptomyces nojiriensis]QTI46949.1 D-alanyl-D-alanine carboxypeptidase [Streptomyces nojiriensis]GGS18792.1 beta-lactamase [Streptomyces nojiriensis]GHI73438.1 beta-lactamase [Streptomyces nojiriensis]
MSTRWRSAAVALAAVGLVVGPVGAGAGAVHAGVAAASAVTVPAATVPAPTPTPTPASDGFAQLTPAVTRQLDAAIKKVLAEAKIPGVIVAVSAPGKGDYVRSFGIADKATGAPMTPNLNMRIGSVTKTFTVTALLELVDEGKVGLDDPIGKYVDGVPNGDRITLRELAGMRSGLFNYSADEGFYKAFTSNPDRPFTPQELLGYSFKHPVLFEPNAKFYYCNTNLILLGLVVEKVSGVPLDRFIGQKVVVPAGLKHTVFPTGPEFPSPHAHGYTNQTASGKVEDATDWNPSWGWAAGAMISDLPDMRSWAKTLATGTLLTPATQAQRLDVVDALPGTGYGLGIFNVQGWIGHNGSLPGYGSLVLYLPEAKATLVVLLNTDIGYAGQEPSTLVGEAITKIVTPDRVYTLPAQPAS